MYKTKIKIFYYFNFIKMETQIELFNRFPKDIQLYILKENPNFMLVNKYSAQEGRHLFEEKYCNNPISKHEFINYIHSDMKPDFTIYAINNDIYEIWHFKYNGRHYELDKVLAINRMTDILTQYVFIGDGDYLINSISNLYKTYKYIHYDIMSVNNIIKRRQCHMDNFNFYYSMDYVNNMLTYMNDDITSENLFNMSLLNIYFNEENIKSNNKIIEPNKNIIDTYKNNILNGYNSIVTQLELLK